MLLWSLTRSWVSTYKWGSQPQQWQQRVLRSGTYKRVRPIPQIKLSWDGKDQYLKSPASFVARISILGCLNHVQSPCLMVTWLKESTWINRTILEDWDRLRPKNLPAPCHVHLPVLAMNLPRSRFRSCAKPQRNRGTTCPIWNGYILTNIWRFPQIGVPQMIQK